MPWPPKRTFPATRSPSVKELRTADQEELAELRADREALVRVVNQLTLQHRQFRRQLTAPAPVVRIPA
ncbi:hypothetical protein [Streptomyces sp. NPDC052721]|uniref:hypothetical protein n=1 Tax=Streptomyces sp. NPDC052721 TaxID=3154955 RepID=UPI003443282C